MQADNGDKELGLPVGGTTKIYGRSRSVDPDGRQSEIITIESIFRARLLLFLFSLFLSFSYAMDAPTSLWPFFSLLFFSVSASRRLFPF